VRAVEDAAQGADDRVDEHRREREPQRRARGEVGDVEQAQRRFRPRGRGGRAVVPVEGSPAVPSDV
jgi:hypothetical protein